MTQGSIIQAKLPAWVDAVLTFWFEEVGEKSWFRKDDALDAAIRDRFLMIHGEVAETPAAEALTDARRALAAAIVLDQFPRNMFRGTARAFATDALARDIAEGAVSACLDLATPPDRRVFLYLPFEHSECLADQDRSVALITSLGNEEQTRYAEAHRAVILRFGRFPHRNAILGRPSSDAELAFLAEPGSSF